MTNVDQFESMFRSASREVFQYERVNIESVLVLTDRDEEDAKLFGDRSVGSWGLSAPMRKFVGAR